MIEGYSIEYICCDACYVLCSLAKRNIVQGYNTEHMGDTLTHGGKSVVERANLKGVERATLKGVERATVTSYR